MKPVFRPGTAIIITAPTDPAVIASQTWRMAPPPPDPWVAIWMWGESEHEDGEFDSYEEAVAWSQERSDYIRVVGDGGPDGVRTLSQPQT
jgi:hypothetical protein